MIPSFYRLLLRFRWAVLALLVAATAAMAYRARRVPVESASTDLFPSTHPYVVTFRNYSDRFGNANRMAIMLAVERGTIFNPRTLQKIQNIHRAVELLPGVNKNQLLSIASRKARTPKASARGLSSVFVMWPEVPTSDAGARAVRQAVVSSRFLHGTLVSRDEKAALIVCEFFEHQRDSKLVFTQVQQIIARESDANTKIHAIGRPILLGEIQARSPQLAKIIGVTSVFMLFALWLAFRNLVGVLVPASAALLSAAMGLGFLGVIRQSFDPLAIVIPFVISARALSHSAQMVSRFEVELERGGGPLEAAQRSAVALFRPGLLAVITDVAGAALIYLVPIPFLQKLALMSAFWLLSIFVSGMILSPVLLSLLPARTRTSRRKSISRGTLDAIGRLCTGTGRKAVFVVSVLALVPAFFFARQLVIGDVHPGTALLWPDSTYNYDTGKIAERFTNTEQLTVVVEGSAHEAIKSAKMLATVEAFQRHMEQLPVVGATLSIADIVPSAVSVLHGADPKWELIPDRNEELGFFLELLHTTGDPGDRDRFVTSDNKDASVTIFLRDHKGETLRRVIAHARQFMDSHPMQGARFRLAGGFGGLLAAINEDITRFDARITLGAFASVFLCCAFAFRSLSAGLLLLLPLIGSNYATYAVMGIAGIGLDVNALPVVALGIGLGVDYGLYVVQSIKERYLQLPDVDLAIREGILDSGKGALVTALTTAFGLVFWAFSFLRFQAEMGILLLVWMIMSMLGGLIIVPSILRQLKPSFVFGPKLADARDPKPEQES